MITHARFGESGWSLEVVSYLLTSNGLKYITLPTYSPELNPTELVFAHLKKELKKKALEVNLVEAITDILSSVTVTQMIGWYQHCGYELSPSSDDDGEDTAGAESGAECEIAVASLAGIATSVV